MEDLFAHKNGDRLQTLQDHLIGVAKLANQFASEFSNADWAEYAGLLHDVGKSASEWQNYLKSDGKKTTSVKHSEAGAQCAYNEMGKEYAPFENVVSYLIAGHHAGLPDWYGESGRGLKDILSENKQLHFDSFSRLSSVKQILKPKTIPFGNNNVSKEDENEIFEQCHLWIRMLFSCLVDADFLDTERFMYPEIFSMRGKYDSLSNLSRRLDEFMQQKQLSANNSRINSIRQQILSDNIKAAMLSPGFFSENVPTGGGKTLATMSFALHHAIQYSKKRIIVAIPYTSIIEQTAKIYKYGSDDINEIRTLQKENKCLLGERNVLEHHCNFDFISDENREVLKEQKIAAENWDAPIIVTTNVQLFESIFNAHPSRTRKLHNIANSVIILDEVQMLPPEYLKSILSALKGLVKFFGVTVVLSSATIPAIYGKIGSDGQTFEGIPLEKVRPIIHNPSELAFSLKRINLNTSLCHNRVDSWQNIADELCKFNQVLCIVPTREACRNLYNLMPAETYHLSALMCAEDRSETISEIKLKLKKNEAVRVISTQLVECGVDIDFPVVFRALAGMDSIAQSAGRCNREGKRASNGEVFLFNPPMEIPRGLLRKGADVTKTLLEKYDYKLELGPEVYEEYFDRYYKMVNCFDRPNFSGTMLQECRSGCFEFRTLSDNYHLIENDFQVSVFVRFCSARTGKNNIDLLQQLYCGNIDKNLLQKLARYSVNLPLKEVRKLVREGRLNQPVDGLELYVQSMDDVSFYLNGVGIIGDSIQSFEDYIF